MAKVLVVEKVIGVPSLLLTIYIFAQECLRSTKRVKVEEQGFEQSPEIDPLVARQRTLSIAGWIVGFFLAIWLLGFTAASAAATFLYLKFGAGERWPISLALTAASWLFFFGLFDYSLQLPFPTGALFYWVPSTVAALGVTF